MSSHNQTSFNKGDQLCLKELILEGQSTLKDQEQAKIFQILVKLSSTIQIAKSSTKIIIQNKFKAKIIVEKDQILVEINKVKFIKK